MFSPTITEETLKNQVADRFFETFIYEGNNPSYIDFRIAPKQTRFEQSFYQTSMLWAEAKKGEFADIAAALTQLVLTIGHHAYHQHHSFLTPLFLGAFDSKEIIFVEYAELQALFADPDINWKSTPSNHGTKDFALLYKRIAPICKSKAYRFKFKEQESELKTFITNSFKAAATKKIQISKNNFVNIYLRWEREVKPTISIGWDEAAQAGIIDADFYLADILSEDNKTISEKLAVILETDKYLFDKEVKHGALRYTEAVFTDGQAAHSRFWQIFKRPPKEEFAQHIIAHRHLLLPFNYRQRRGAFFTPRIWAHKAQEYLAATLGEEWQDEYIIWDCAAGTGNLLAGLTAAPRNIYASTIDKADLQIIKEDNATSHKLLDGNIFEFDFLNDAFIPKKDGGKLPDSLYNIISDPDKRKKLVVFINPPYAEATSYGEESKALVATETMANKRYKSKIGNASNELFAQFFARIYDGLGGCILGAFATPKYLNGPNFKEFREFFRADFKGGFVVNSNDFENISKSQGFPIVFMVWDTTPTPLPNRFFVQIYKRRTAQELRRQKGNILAINDGDSASLGNKTFINCDDINLPNINEWIKNFDDKKAKKAKKQALGFIGNPAPNFQTQQQLYAASRTGSEHFNYIFLTPQNLFAATVYYAVRHAIAHTWINHNDQFYAPNDSWQGDTEFKNNCLAFMICDEEKNKITSAQSDGYNYFNPFSEDEICAQERFHTDFMHKFINGKYRANGDDIFTTNGVELEWQMIPATPLIFSAEAQAVLDAARRLFGYYHKVAYGQNGFLNNASLYEIKGFFQGFSIHKGGKQKMNATSSDETYTALIADLRAALKELAKKIEPKIYEHGFLKA